jgi:hypothetical protein
MAAENKNLNSENPYSSECGCFGKYCPTTGQQTKTCSFLCVHCTRGKIELLNFLFGVIPFSYKSQQEHADYQKFSRHAIECHRLLNFSLVDNRLYITFRHNENHKRMKIKIQAHFCKYDTKAKDFLLFTLANGFVFSVLHLHCDPMQNIIKNRHFFYSKHHFYIVYQKL